MSATLVDLLAALHGVPDLPGARCKGHPRMFDPAHVAEEPHQLERRHRIALSTCAVCPALTDCRMWLESLPVQDRPDGIVAGQSRAPRKPRKGAE